jgi:hypothetical protein
VQECVGLSSKLIDDLRISADYILSELLKLKSHIACNQLSQVIDLITQMVQTVLHW